MNTNLARSRRGNAFAVPVSMQVCEKSQGGGAPPLGAGARLGTSLLCSCALYTCTFYTCIFYSCLLYSCVLYMCILYRYLFNRCVFYMCVNDSCLLAWYFSAAGHSAHVRKMVCKGLNFSQPLGVGNFYVMFAD